MRLDIGAGFKEEEEGRSPGEKVETFFQPVQVGTTADEDDALHGESPLVVAEMMILSGTVRYSIEE